MFLTYFQFPLKQKDQMFNTSGKIYPWTGECRSSFRVNHVAGNTFYLLGLMNDIFISQMGHVLNFWFLLFLDCSLFISGVFSEMCIFSQQQMIVSNPNDPYEWWRLVSDTPVSLSILYIFISVSCLRRDIRKDPWNKYFIEWSLMKQIKSIICDNIICKSMQIIVFLSFKF